MAEENVPVEKRTLLYNILTQSEIATKELADKWVNDYKKNDEKNLLSLISLIFQSCGCKVKLSPDKLEVKDWRSLVMQIESEMHSTSLSKYPILMKKEKLGKKLCDFIEHILLKTYQDILFDGQLLPHLCDLLSALSISQFRAFRHTSTLIVVKMMTTLSTIMRALTSQYTKLNAQLSSEINKRASDVSNDRKELLEGMIKNLSEQMTEVENGLEYFRKGVLFKRFRDVFGIIRLICIEELEVWLVNYPSAFITETYLKFLGWALCDPLIQMRLKCLQILKKIYSENKYTQVLDVFTEKFKNRIFSMPLDKSYCVSVVGIQVISAIMRHYSGHFEQADKKKLLYLVYSDNKEVAEAAGYFLYQCLVEELQDTSTFGAQFSLSCLFYLKDFLENTEGLDKIPFLVDAIIGLPEFDFLVNWKFYAEILLHHENLLEEKHYQSSLSMESDMNLSYSEERIFISIMTNSIKQYVLKQCPRKMEDNYPLPAKIAKQSNEKAKSSVNYLLEFLPKLMKKYSADAKIISDLLSICFIIDLSLVNSCQDFRSLFESMAEIAEKHIDLEVQLECAKVMAHFTKGDSPLASLFQTNFIEPYLNEVATSWKESLLKYSSKCSELEELHQILEDQDIIFDLEKNSTQLWAISCHFFLRDSLDWEEISYLCKGIYVDAQGKNFPVTNNVMCNSLKTALAYIFWEASSEDFEHDDLCQYHIDDLFLILEDHLESPSKVKVSVRLIANICLSEMMCVFNKASLVYPRYWKNKIVSATNRLVNTFLDILSQIGDFENVTEEETDDAIKNFCSLLLRRGLPNEATLYLLININNEAITTRNWETVKKTISVIQSRGMDDFSMIVLNTLTYGYMEAVEHYETDRVNGKEFFELLILAKKLYFEYGPDLKSCRKAVVKFHLKGILFATDINLELEDPLHHIHFSEILVIFAPLLCPSEKKKVYQHLNNHLKVLENALLSVSAKANESLAFIKKYQTQLSAQENQTIRRKKKQLPED